TGLTGLDQVEIPGVYESKYLKENKTAILKSLEELSPMRILRVAQALRYGISKQEIHDACKIDPWFIEQIAIIIDYEERLK
ncbi:hypothetical protein NAI31_10895, partial [Francisella tularensis subsp. holarctica]|uniref:hypothetical protein n=1 Tax=Francisella tularensis TaxID=263 RepID=UPI002381C291